MATDTSQYVTGTLNGEKTTFTSKEAARQAGGTLDATVDKARVASSARTGEQSMALAKTPEYLKGLELAKTAPPGSLILNGQLQGGAANVDTSRPSPETIKAGFNQTMATGAPAPQEYGEGASAVQKATATAATTPSFYKPDPNNPQVVDAQGNKLSFDQYIAAGGKADFSNVTPGGPPVPSQATPLSGIEQSLAADPGYQQLLADRKEFVDVAAQGQSLMSMYDQMVKKAGIPAINKELINTKRIIEGTEDDIRSEVQAASGFATDSQVLALSSARNKQLIKNYNNLLDTKAMAMEQINTMVNLASQDRNFAMQSITQKMNIDAQIEGYREKFISNAQEGYKNVINAVGYDGLYQSLASSGDPNAIALAEKTLGMPVGTLKGAAQSAYQAKALDNQLKQAQIANIYSEIGNRNNSGLAGMDAPGLIAYAQQYASTGQIPTGLPKGSFGVISELAKGLPKSNGTLVDKNTGVKPSNLSATQLDGITALYDLQSKLDQAQSLFKSIQSKGQTGLIGGLLGKVVPGSEVQAYNSLKGEISDLLARARSGAALTEFEVKQYENKLPSTFNQPLWLGTSGTQSINNLKSSLGGKLNSILDVNGAAIYGFTPVTLEGQTFKVGDIITNGSQQAKVMPDGSLNVIGQ